MDKILNIKKAMEIFDNDVSLYKELMNIFLMKYPKYMDEILDDIDNKKFKELSFKAHRLKGMLQNLGADRASKTAAILEKENSQNRNEDYKSVYTHLNRELVNLKIFFIKNINLIH